MMYESKLSTAQISDTIFLCQMQIKFALKKSIEQKNPLMLPSYISERKKNQVFTYAETHLTHISAISKLCFKKLKMK